jgi:hypothetical protein
MARYIQTPSHRGAGVGDYVDAGPQEAFGNVGNYVDVPGYMGNAGMVAAGAGAMIVSTVLTGFTIYGIYAFATRKKRK